MKFKFGIKKLTTASWSLLSNFSSYSESVRPHKWLVVVTYFVNSFFVPVLGEVRYVDGDLAVSLLNGRLDLAVEASHVVLDLHRIHQGYVDLLEHQ